MKLIKENSLTISSINVLVDFEIYVGAEVLLTQNGDHMQAARIVKVATDPLGKEKGIYNPNPILDSRVYEVMFPDGAVEQYTDNNLAENMLGQVDDYGHRHQLLESITDHRTDGTESDTQESYITRGHELKCDWTDGTAS